MLGKRLYKTSMLNFFRLGLLGIIIFFFNNFYLETFTYEKFLSARKFSVLDVMEYHLKYPAELIAFISLIIVPGIYYGLIRGVGFHEKGFRYNKGVPFMNKNIMYEEIKRYKLLHPKKAISVHLKKGDVFVIADNDVERVIAILDQHNIPGDLAQDDYIKLLANYKKFLLVVAGFAVFLFVAKKLSIFFH